MGLTQAGEEKVRTALQIIPYAPPKGQAAGQAAVPHRTQESVSEFKPKSAGSWKGGSFSELCERESVGRCRKTGQDAGL